MRKAGDGESAVRSISKAAASMASSLNTNRQQYERSGTNAGESWTKRSRVSCHVAAALVRETM